MPVIDADALIENRVEAIRAYHDQCGVPKGALDVSGGIDSAVMAMLLVKALGAQNCIFDHTIIHTDTKQTLKAENLCSALGVPLAVGDFTEVFRDIVSEVIGSIQTAYDVANPNIGREIRARMQNDATIQGSIRSTLRAPLGRAYNRILGGGIRHGTGNECEDRWLRFYQKGGDGEVDTNPIAMLSKSEVYQLAYALGHEMGIYESVRPIIESTPSPDLWGKGEEVHTDEAELKSWLGVPFTYGRINPDTGEVTHHGTIERVSRLLDVETPYLDVRYSSPMRVEAVLFDSREEPDWKYLDTFATRQPCWQPVPKGMVLAFLKAARKAEAQTRHKENPNIPMLGTRKELVKAGILTNELPQVAE